MLRPQIRVTLEALTARALLDGLPRVLIVRIPAVRRNLFKVALHPRSEIRETREMQALRRVVLRHPSTPEAQA